jgi:hypothetical protein
MALVANATKLSLNSTKVPSGATDPGGTNLSGSQPTYSNLVLTVAKATVEDATASTTFDNIRTDVTIGIEKQVADLLANDMDDTVNTINYNIDWKNIEGNMEFPREFYTNVAAQYICTIDVYTVIS